MTHRRRGDPWTRREENLIREYASQGLAAICEYIPYRTPRSVRVHAWKLGIAVKRKRQASGAYRWRGRIPLPEHTSPLVRSFFNEMNKQRVLVSEIADRAGIDRGTISDWRYRRAPGLHLFIAALNVLDLDLKIVPIKEPGDIAAP